MLENVGPEMSSRLSFLTFLAASVVLGFPFSHQRHPRAGTLKPVKASTKGICRWCNKLEPWRSCGSSTKNGRFGGGQVWGGWGPKRVVVVVVVGSLGMELDTAWDNCPIYSIFELGVLEISSIGPVLDFHAWLKDSSRIHGAIANCKRVEYWDQQQWHTRIEGIVIPWY